MIENQNYFFDHIIMYIYIFWKNEHIPYFISFVGYNLFDYNKEIYHIWHDFILK